MLNPSLILNQNNNQNNKLEIFWIDKKIKNEENQRYIMELKYNNNSQLDNDIINKPFDVYISPENLSKSKYDIQEYTEMDKAIEQIKKIRFIETIIIVSGSYLPELINQFKDNLKQIYIIPKIIVFTSPDRKFDEKVLKEKFYSGVILTTFKQLKSVINSYQIKNEQIIRESQQLMNTQYNAKTIFVPIKTKNDLKLPKYYIDMVDRFKTVNNPNFISAMFNIYKTEEKYNYLLHQMINFPEIPIELLCKYYARLYSIDGDFYKRMNDYLVTVNYLSNDIIYEPYIKTLYEGFDKDIFKIYLSGELYCSQALSDGEIKELWSYKENFLKDSKDLEKDLPLPIIFSKSFLSFNKDIIEAEKYLRYGKNAMLILKAFSNEFDLKTHADIEEFSYYPNEKEVLFFPFSAFGINKFEYNPVKSLYIVELIYYGKFNKDFDVKRDPNKCCFLI